MIVNINLQQLLCSAQTRSDGSKPYLWSILLQIDDETISSGVGAAVASFPPPPDGARTLISKNMRAGDTAAIPSSVAHFGCRFIDSSAHKDLLLITVLLDEHDTPGHAVAAGYNIFLRETRSAVADNLFGLASKDPQTVDATIATIKTRLKTAVYAAIKNELDFLDKAVTFAHLSTPDVQIDSQFKHLNFAAPPLPHGPISLDYTTGTATHFQLTAALAVTDDPCESEQIAVSIVQANIASIHGAMLQLGRSTREGSQHDKLASQLDQELATAQAQLKTAQDALGRCRLRQATSMGTNTGGQAKSAPAQTKPTPVTTEPQAKSIPATAGRSLKTP